MRAASGPDRRRRASSAWAVRRAFPVLLAVVAAVAPPVSLGPHGARLASGATLAVEAAPREIHVGDPIRITIRLTAEEGSDVALPVLAESVGDFEVLSVGSPTEERGPDGERILSVEATVTAWATGDLTIPPLSASGTADLEAGSVRSDPVPITVASVGIESSEDLRPIKDPLSLPIEWARIALIALAALLAAIVAFLVARRLRRRPAAVPAAPISTRPAHEVALEAIDRLASEGLVARGRVAEHTTRLTDILRRYFEARFGFPALDRTTSEILVALRKPLDRAGIRRSIDLHAEIADLLHEADLVKFAEFSPDPAAASATVERARSIVEATREEEAPPLAAAS